MFPLLTKYLVQYGQVCIPHIGTFELVQESSQLDVADKIVKPPFFTTRFLKQDGVPDHQFRFLADSAGNARKDLLIFGEQLRETVQRAPYRWNGFGTLSYASNELLFQPESILVQSLAQVQARKVIRENAQHSMLVGDKEMRSDEMPAVLKKSESRVSIWLLIGFGLLVAALVAIGIVLYQGGFRIGASGLRLPAAASV